VWLATPSPYGTFIHYTLPVLTGAFGSKLDGLLPKSIFCERKFRYLLFVF
jgi:hypothetical protein